MKVGNVVEWRHSANHNNDDCMGTIVEIHEESAMIYWWRSGGTFKYTKYYIKNFMKVII